MRIVAGSLGGRKIDSPPGHRTHPMSEKVRGALFNALGDITNLTVLDAFGGSGALALEAISRGAKHAVVIDIDKSAINTIVNNARSLGVTDNIKAIKANISSWSHNNPDQLFDLILCDPPYDEVNAVLLSKIAEYAKNDGVLVFSLPPDTRVSLDQARYKLLLEKSYGDAQLIFYRKV